MPPNFLQIVDEKNEIQLVTYASPPSAKIELKSSHLVGVSRPVDLSARNITTAAAAYIGCTLAQEARIDLAIIQGQSLATRSRAYVNNLPPGGGLLSIWFSPNYAQDILRIRGTVNDIGLKDFGSYTVSLFAFACTSE